MKFERRTEIVLFFRDQTVRFGVRRWGRSLAGLVERLGGVASSLAGLLSSLLEVLSLVVREMTTSLALVHSILMLIVGPCQFTHLLQGVVGTVGREGPD